MGRILEGVQNATESVEFFIFAFTKDQLGSLLIEKHLEFEMFNVCCDPENRYASDEVSDATCTALRNAAASECRCLQRVKALSRKIRTRRHRPFTASFKRLTMSRIDSSPMGSPFEWMAMTIVISQVTTRRVGGVSTPKPSLSMGVPKTPRF